MRRECLVFGGSGFIGRHLLRALGSEKAIGTCCATPQPNGIRFDAVKDDVRTLLDQAGPFRYGFVLLAESRIDQCARDPSRAEALNVEGVKRVVDALHERDILPVFASTDYVFDGVRGRYTEKDPPHPILTYGRQKVEIERYLAASGGPYIAARLSKVVDLDPAGPGMLGEWIRAIRKGEEVYCAADQRFSAIDVRDVVRALVALAEGAPPGVYHVGGPRAWDRARLFESLVRAIRRHADIEPMMRRCGINDFAQFLEPRPIDISMRSDRLERTVGVKPRDLEETCAEFARAIAGSSRLRA